MSAESGRINVRPGVHVCAVREEQVKNLLLIEINGEVQQGRSVHRCAVHSGASIIGAPQFGRINLPATEAAID